MKIEGLSLEEVNLIIAGLAELPAKFSMELINKIKSQVQPQMEPDPSTIPATK